MKRFLALLLTFMLLFSGGAYAVDDTEDDSPIISRFFQSFAGIGIGSLLRDTSDNKTAEPTAAPRNTTTVQNKTSAKSTSNSALLSFEFENECHVSVIGVESYINWEGLSCLKIYYDYTNLSDVPQCARNVLNIYARQNGRDLTALSYDELNSTVIEGDSGFTTICPGVTLRCVMVFRYNEGIDSNIVVTFDDWYNERVPSTIEFDPDKLPVSAIETKDIEPISDPQLTAGWPISESFTHYNLAFTGDYELVQLQDGTVAICVYFSYTNTGNDRRSPVNNVILYAYQDGVELSEIISQDGGYYEYVDPGETAVFSQCWELRSDNPVEVAVAVGWFGENSMGMVFTVD